MAKPRRNSPPVKSPPKAPAQPDVLQNQDSQPQLVQVEAKRAQSVQTFEGPIPPPELLRQYDNVVNGAAERILAMAERESSHRHLQETKAIDANISAQEKQLQINDSQVKSSFRSDALGQSFGFLISGGCIAGAIFLGINDHTVVASALAAIPSAAIIKAFLIK